MSDRWQTNEGGEGEPEQVPEAAPAPAPGPAPSVSGIGATADRPAVPPRYAGAAGAQPAWTPPPPPQGGAVPGYQPPPRPPRPRRGGFMRVLFILLMLAGLGFIGISLAGKFLLGDRSRGGTIAFGDRIGLLRIEGMISQGPEKEFWMKSLREMRDNARIKGIVVRIDSPGGTVGASQEIYSMLQGIRNGDAGKPVYVSMGDVAASGGYYIAAASDRIFAMSGTMTGSIGVIMSKPELSGLTERFGFEMETIKSGRFKDAGAITRPITPEERQMFDLMIQDTYQQFLQDILNERAEELAKACRDLPREAWAAYDFAEPVEVSARALLEQVADGRVYTGRQALQLGLVDQIGTLDDVIARLAGEVGISGVPQVEERRLRRTIFGAVEAAAENILPRGHAPVQYRMLVPTLE